MKQAYTARRLFTPTEEIASPLLVVEDGRIIEFLPARKKSCRSGASFTDFGDAMLAPGFFDIHMHGGAGIDLMRASRLGAAAAGPIPHHTWGHGIFSHNRRRSARCDLCARSTDSRMQSKR